MSTNESSRSSDEEQAPSQTSVQLGPSGAIVRKARAQAKWPIEKITIMEIDDDGVPTEKKALQMLRKLAGLNARERVPLTLPKFDDLTMDQKNALFNDGVNTFLEFSENMKAKACSAYYENDRQTLEKP